MRAPRQKVLLPRSCVLALIGLAAPGCPIGRSYGPTDSLILRPTDEKTFAAAEGDARLSMKICREACGGGDQLRECHAVTVDMTPPPPTRKLRYGYRNYGKGDLIKGAIELPPKLDPTDLDPDHLPLDICQQHFGSAYVISECSLSPVLGPAPAFSKLFVECLYTRPGGYDLVPR